MTIAGYAKIRIELKTIDELFAAPQLDPLTGRFEIMSGIDRIEQQAKALPRAAREQGQIEIALPRPAEDLSGLEQRVGLAIFRYSRERMERTAATLTRTLRAGRDALWLGLAFLACCLALSSAFAAATGLPPLIQRLFSEGFMIAGWVALWRPVELLLYDSWPLRRDKRVLRAMAKMPVSIIEADLPPAPAAPAATAAGKAAAT